ncbi:hypothetical protein [Kitasatospora sp. NPDC004289]
MTTAPSASITPDLPLWTSDDRPRTTFQLSVTESTGPFVDDNGWEQGQTCPGCDLRPADGEEILRFGDQWWHLTCTRTRMRTGGADAAWLMLGADLAARPSRYSVAETRAIVRNLLRLTAVPSAPEA